MAHGNLYGLQYGWVTRIDGNGIATGQLDPDAPGTAPLTSSAFLIHGPMTLKLAKSKRNTTKFSGGGVSEGSVQGGVTNIDNAELQVSQDDTDLRALIQGGLLDTTTLTGTEISAPNHMNPNPPMVAFCGICKIDLKGSVKRSEYKHFFYPRCTMSVAEPDTSQADSDQTNPSPLTITIAPNVTNKFVGGVAMTIAQNWYQSSEFQYEKRLLYPLWLTAWLQDGIATTFTLGYVPKYSDVTAGKLNNWVLRNGTPTAPTSISTTTGLVTMAAVGTAAQWTNVFSPTDPSLIV